MEDNKPVQYNGGLNTDYNPSLQPEGTSRFVLNGTVQSEKGDIGFLGNEESNENLLQNIPQGFHILNSTYIGDGETALFLVNRTETISEIGILDRNNKYVTSISDEDSPLDLKLNFKLHKSIKATYRLRQGCNKTIYFSDKFSEPRVYDFKNPQKFKNDAGETDANLFSLCKNYSTIPNFDNLSVLDTGGQLEPGSISVGIMLVDSNLNPTPVIKASKPLRIYNDKYLGEEFERINGSINSDVDYEDFSITTKAIKVEVSDIDEAYEFYRLVFLEYTSGNGIVTDVKITGIIPKQKKDFIYTGENYESKITEEEVIIDNVFISKAGVIEQIDNLLILGDLEGENINYCQLQKYASRITTDAISREVIINTTSQPSNSKNPTLNFEGLIEYMPGEIYSFGIEYLFPKGIKSPVYHIPGKNATLTTSTTFTESTDPLLQVHGMSNNNQSISIYTNNENCEDSGQEDLWGADSEGLSLANTPIRHHRFPTRKESGIGFVTALSSSESSTLYKKLQITVTGITRATCSADDVTDGICGLAADIEPFDFIIKYQLDTTGEIIEQTFTINPSNFSFVTPIDENKVAVNYSFFSEILVASTVDVLEIKEPNYSFVLEDVTAGPGQRGLTYTTSVIDSTESTNKKLYKVRLLGVRFSNITMPSIEDTSGFPVIGYNIVRQVRTEEEKTVLDSAIVFPALTHAKYIGSGLIYPEIGTFKANPVSDGVKLGAVSKKVFSFLSTEHLFKDVQYKGYTELDFFGSFCAKSTNYSKMRYNDVAPGSTYNSSAQKDGNDDGGTMDGFGFATILRDTETEWRPNLDKVVLSDEIEDTFYLTSLDYKNIENETKEVVNVSGDNRVGILQLKDDTTLNLLPKKCPYVYFKRELKENYINFRLDPYYYETDNHFNPVQDTCDIFAGDTYVNPLRHTNNIYWETRAARRAGKKSIIKIILGALIIAVGVFLTFLTLGVSTLLVGAGVALIGAGALYAAAGIKKEAYNRAYKDSYKKGLKKTALDEFVSIFYIKNTSIFGVVNYPYTNDGPSDDEIQWITDCATDFWVESAINIGLRNKMVSNLPCYLNAPGKIEQGMNAPLIGWEFFGIHYEDAVTRSAVSALEKHTRDKHLYFDDAKKNGRGYIGHPLGEYYKVNPDYLIERGIKSNYHLPIEYDCCSDCPEKFPQRWRWSEQSFQEELTDNYRVFLPNNYKDMDGETGGIMEMFKYNNDLFVHTKEGFWQLPRNYQERVTDQVVSFLGTGSLFEIPPRKLMDDDKGNTFGLQYAFSSSKTPVGYFFPNNLQKNVNLFGGGSFDSVSEIGCSMLFKESLPVKLEEEYFEVFGKEYPYKDAPAHPLGTGFISAYDSVKKRILLTKIDKNLHEDLMSPENQFTYYNGELIIFYDLQQIIIDKAEEGFIFQGIKEGKAVFKRIVSVVTEEEITVTTTTTTTEYVSPQDVVIKVSLPTESNLLATNAVNNQIISVVESWKTDLITHYSAYINSITVEYYGINAGSPALTKPVNAGIVNSSFLSRFALTGGVTNPQLTPICSNPNYCNSGKNIIYLDFNYSHADYFHTEEFTGQVLGIPSDLAKFNTEVNLEEDARTVAGGFLGALLVPIVPSGISGYAVPDPEEAPMQNLAFQLAMLKNDVYTAIEANNVPLNVNILPDKWSALKTEIRNSNLNLHKGLETFDYKVYSNSRIKFITGLGGTITGYMSMQNIISKEILNNALSSVLEPSEIITEETTTGTITRDVTTYEVEYDYVDGIVFEENPIAQDKSFTMSFDVKYRTWISFHSYLPNHYIITPEKMFSWKIDKGGIWEHHKKGSYGLFYGDRYDFITENIYYKNPMLNVVTEDIKLFLETMKYHPANDDYYEVDGVFFNKAVFYNSKQCSGELEIIVKDNEAINYFQDQILNTPGKIIVDKNEKDWTLNEIRDFRIDYTKPIWKTRVEDLQTNYFIDKVLDNSTINFNKDWTEIEQLRDKFLAVRLIFNNLADVKLLMKFSSNTDTVSDR